MNICHVFVNFVWNYNTIINSDAAVEQAIIITIYAPLFKLDNIYTVSKAYALFS